MRRPLPGQSIQENIMAGPRVQDTIDAGPSDDRRGGDRHCTVYRLARTEREGDAGLWGVRNIRSEEHTSELQSLMRRSYAVFCLKKTNNDLTSTGQTRHTTHHKY